MFRTASPIDEELMAAQFNPYVDKGDISNLPRYKFYMRLAAIEPEEPFSGQTLPIITNSDLDHFNNVIKASRKNYAKTYQSPKHQPTVNSIKLKFKKQQQTRKIPSKHKDIRTLI